MRLIVENNYDVIFLHSLSLTITVHLDGRVHGVQNDTRIHGPRSRAVNTGSVYRTPVPTGRVGKKHCRET